MDLKVRKTTFAGRTYRWLGSAFGLQYTDGVTLDLAKFDFSTVFTTRRIPGGVVLGKVTASGKYGPYDNAAVDGREVAVGILFDDLDVPDGESTGDRPVAMITRANIIEANLPTNHGLDANAKTDLTSRIWFK